MKKICKDDRPITALFFTGGRDGFIIRVGDDGVTSIQAYWDEGGVWFTVLSGKDVVGRVTPQGIYVRYQESDDTQR